MNELVKTLYANRDPERAAGMAAYMKNQFPFLGLPKPTRVALQKEFIKETRQQKKIDWAFVRDMWNLPEREFQYVALDYLRALQSNLQKADIDPIKTLIVTKSWWDTVDILATTAVGTLCSEYPELIPSHILPWAESDNIWLVRTAILYQLKYKTQTDTEILSLIIEKNSSKEFFINKAIGWILREYSKTDPEWTRDFLDNHSLATLSVREASKYL